MELVPVIPGEFDLDQIQWALDSFADRAQGKHTAQSYRNDILCGNAQAWLAVSDEIKAVALTEVQIDGLKTVTLTGCTGEDARAWVFLVEGIKQWARELGSRRFEAIARPGWERHLQKYGFKKTHVILEADL